jgi:hypothetical protein
MCRSNWTGKLKHAASNRTSRIGTASRIKFANKERGKKMLGKSLNVSEIWSTRQSSD